ncbi:MAG: hypothetical protein ACRDZR_11930, partial [Acidimicrobiales bacterium]
MTARSRMLRTPVGAGGAPSSSPAEPASAAAVLPGAATAVGDREHWLAETLVTLADTVADELDLDRHLAGVADSFSHLLGDHPVAVTVVGEGPRDGWTVAGTSPVSRALLRGEEATGTGPATEAMRNGRAVAAPVPGERDARWAAAVPAFRRARVRSVYA